MPDWKSLVRHALPQLSTDGEARDDIVEELTTHLQDRYDELRASGLSEQQSIETTLDELTATNRIKLAHPQRRPSVVPAPEGPRARSPVTYVWRDVRYAARLLWRAPGLTVIMISTLALGIAANTTAFTVINTLLLNPIPVNRASDLVSVATRETRDLANANARLPLSYLNLEDFRASSNDFSNIAGHSAPLTIMMTSGHQPERMFAELVTANFFDTLGVKPRHGRFFLPEEDRTPGAHPVLVLGFSPWQHRFAGRTDIVGRRIELGGTSFTIVGIAPEGFKGLDPVFGPDIWIPAMMTPRIAPAPNRGWLTDRAALAFDVVGRLRPGRTLAGAESNLQAIAAQLEHDYPAANRGRRISILPLTRSTLLGVTPQMALLASAALMAIPGLVLLIACSNVASLLLALATARRHEIGVRLALGASRSRVLQQLLTESALLATLGGTLGLAAAAAASRVLSWLRPAEYAENLVDIRMDLHVVWFTIAVSAMTAIVFGIAPALHASRGNLVGVLGNEARIAGQQKRFVGTRHVLLVGQVALSLMALVTAGLFLQSVQRAYAIDPGFDREHLAVVLLNPGQAGFDRPRTEQLYQTLRDRVGALPGVRSVSLASNLPLFSRPSRKIEIEGHADTTDSGGVLAVVNTVDRNYFATSGVALSRGREFLDSDREGRLPVVVVNEVLADRYWPNQNPIGRRVSFADDRLPRTIVGVARTANYESVGEPPQPCVYVPLAQNFTDAIVLYVRAAGDSRSVLASVQRELRQVGDHLNVDDMRTGQKVVDQALFGATITGGLLGVFGLLALSLASLGMYGVMAYNVTLRRREMGVRLALGADSRRVLTLVLRDGLTLVSVGLAIGGVGAVGLGMALSSFVSGVGPIDPVSFATAIGVLLAVAAVACYLPARRASLVDPISVLRAE